MGDAGDVETSTPRVSRRKVLAICAGGVVAAITGGLELVNHGVLPGKTILEEVDGACDVAAPEIVFGTIGAVESGTFFSAARRREVSYSIGFPGDYTPGEPLPLVVALHGFGETHLNVFEGLTLARAIALKVHGTSLPPFAIAAADGGNGYWHAHPGDDPMAMIVDELIPMCQRRSLGVPSRRIGSFGISMGGYGAVLLAEKHPDLISAVGAISAAVWTSYGQAKSANESAYVSAADFGANDVVSHAVSLRGIPVRLASGYDDPFFPGVQALAAALPTSSDNVVAFSGGCHGGQFGYAAQPATLAFLAAHLA